MKKIITLLVSAIIIIAMFLVINFTKEKCTQLSYKEVEKNQHAKLQKLLNRELPFSIKEQIDVPLCELPKKFQENRVSYQIAIPPWNNKVRVLKCTSIGESYFIPLNTADQLDTTNCVRVRYEEWEIPNSEFKKIRL